VAGLHKLLLAIDLSPASATLIKRVVQMYPDELYKIHVLHVIKPLAQVGSLDELPARFDPDMQREVNFARTRLLHLLHESGLGCATDKLHLVHGEPSYQIKRFAEEIHADLVIVGSHSKADDWMHLPGATTNCVIQGISTDVMAVKV